MSRKTFFIWLAALIVTFGGLMLGEEIRKNDSKVWVMRLEMANKNIVWSGAGYNGIYERGIK